jgi:hypothetical protein
LLPLYHLNLVLLCCLLPLCYLVSFCRSFFIPLYCLQPLYHLFITPICYLLPFYHSFFTSLCCLLPFYQSFFTPLYYLLPFCHSIIPHYADCCHFASYSSFHFTIPYLGFKFCFHTWTLTKSGRCIHLCTSFELSSKLSTTPLYYTIIK